MNYTFIEPKVCQRCHNLRTDYERGRKSCDRCLEQLVDYQRSNLDKTKEHRKMRAVSYRATPKGNKVAKDSAKKQRELYPEKFKARYAVMVGLRKGTITKRPCNECGAEKVEAHHDDYDKPLAIVWLCKLHHVRRHHY